MEHYKIKDLLDFVRGFAATGNKISRTDIVSEFENGSELIEQFKSEQFKSVYAQTIPIVFHHDQLITLLEKMLEDAPADEFEAVEATAAPLPENEFVKDAINAALDPSLSKMIKTASYKQLEELIIPEVPINIYISGETGLGKSTAVMRIALELGIPVVRVNLSYTTDVDDLIGGLRLEKDGDAGVTSFQEGPVLQAMRMGAILLLDEVDSANPRILMELQSIMELKGYLIKKTGKMIYPSPSFRVIATGNSKGMGDETGEFIGVAPLNKAFRDRFATYVDFVYPTAQELKRIIQGAVEKCEDDVYESLSKWYGQVLESKNAGVVTNVISPRRMIEVTKLFKVFNITGLLFFKIC